MRKNRENIFREYDIRGIYDQELNDEIGFHIGYNLIHFVGDKKICVACDTRLSSKNLINSLINGLKFAGFEIYDLGIISTPALYFATKKMQINSAIMVTGSHNPKDQNGFKFIVNNRQFYGDSIQKLKFYIDESLKLPKFKNFSENSSYNHISIEEDYIEYLRKKIGDFPITSFKIAWDPGNGATCNILKKILCYLPGEHIIINENMDGNFPNRPPDPMIEKNLHDLKNIIEKNKCDFGIAFDGGGDRINILDNKAAPIKIDILILLFAKFLHNFDKNITVMADVKSSEILFKFLTRLNINNLMYKSGHSVIKAKISQESIDLAGEISGHIFFKDNYYFDDAIYNSIRFSQLISQYEENISEILVNYFPKINACDEIRIYCYDQNKFSLIKQLKEILRNNQKKFIEIDGVRFTDDKGWWLIRASNTENCLTIRYELYDQKNQKIFQEQLEEILSFIKIKLDK